TSSLTTDAGRSTTSPAAIWSATAEGRTAMVGPLEATVSASGGSIARVAVLQSWRGVSCEASIHPPVPRSIRTRDHTPLRLSTFTISPATTLIPGSAISAGALRVLPADTTTASCETSVARYSQSAPAAATTATLNAPATRGRHTLARLTSATAAATATSTQAASAIHCRGAAGIEGTFEKSDTAVPGTEANRGRSSAARGSSRSARCHPTTAPAVSPAVQLDVP